VEKIQIELSDVISFHNYDKSEEFENGCCGCSSTIGQFCARSIWHARRQHVPGNASDRQKYRVAAINWAGGRRRRLISVDRGSILT